RRHSATVRTARVFARPGTPSRRMCPPVSSPTSRRSTISSCPTTRFATSRVIVCASAASLDFTARVVISAPPPPLCAPPAPCPCCRVPRGPAPRGVRCGAAPPPPPRAPSGCVDSPSPPARRAGRAPRAPPWRQGGRWPATTPPVPLRRAPGPAGGSTPWTTPGPPPFRPPPTERRAAQRLEHQRQGQPRERAHGRDQRFPLLGRHARLAEPLHHALDQRAVRERDRYLVDRLDQRRIRGVREQPVQ